MYRKNGILDLFLTQRWNLVNDHRHAAKENTISGIFKRIFVYLLKDVFLPFYNKMIRPHFDYATCRFIQAIGANDSSQRRANCSWISTHGMFGQIAGIRITNSSVQEAKIWYSASLHNTKWYWYYWEFRPVLSQGRVTRGSPCTP